MGFISNLDDSRKNSFFDILLAIHKKDAEATQRLYRFYGKEAKNLYRKPKIDELRQFERDSLANDFSKFLATTNSYEKMLIKAEIFKKIDQASISVNRQSTALAFDAERTSNPLYASKLTSAVIDYYLGNTEAGFLAYTSINRPSGTPWRNLEELVNKSMRSLLSKDDSLNLIKPKLAEDHIFEEIAKTSRSSNSPPDLNGLKEHIESRLGSYKKLGNFSSCLACDKILDEIKTKITMRDKSSPWKDWLLFLTSTFPTNRSGCETYSHVRIKVQQLVVEGQVEIDEVIDLFAMATIEKFGPQSFDFKTRNSYRLVPDFGYVVYGFKAGKFFGSSPYVGISLNFRSFDPDIPLNRLTNLAHWRRLSVNAGLTFNSVAKVDRRENLLGTHNLITGLAFRMNQALKFNIGGLWYNKLDDNPLIDKRRPRPVLYAGISLDFRLQELLGDFGAIFSGGFLPK